MPPQRILLVDDNKNTRAILADVLGLKGYQVDQAPDGVAGLMMVGLNPPDLIILDLEMPRFDGRGVLKTLRENPETQKIPILILTGSGREAEPEMRKLGADDFVEKGRNFDLILDRVLALLQRLP